MTLKSRYLSLFEKNRIRTYKRVVAECATAILALTEMLEEETDSEVILKQQEYVAELMKLKSIIKKKAGYEGGYDAEKVYQFPHNTSLEIGGSVKGTNLTSVYQNCERWITEFEEALRKGKMIDVTKYEMGVYLLAYKGLH